MWVPARRGVGHLCQLAWKNTDSIRGAKMFDILNTQLETGTLEFKGDTCKILVPEFAEQSRTNYLEEVVTSQSHLPLLTAYNNK